MSDKTWHLLLSQAEDRIDQLERELSALTVAHERLREDARRVASWHVNEHYDERFVTAAKAARASDGMGAIEYYASLDSIFQLTAAADKE